MKYIVNTMLGLFVLISASYAQVAGFSVEGGNKKGKAPVSEYEKSITIKTRDVIKYMGKTVRICDQVTEARLANVPKDRASELFVGGHFPDQLLTIVIPENVRKTFSYNPENKMVNKRFCLIGKVEKYRGKPAIIIQKESQINAED